MCFVCFPFLISCSFSLFFLFLLPLFCLYCHCRSPVTPVIDCPVIDEIPANHPKISQVWRKHALSNKLYWNRSPNEVVMVETQTPVVSDVSDTKQLHTQSPKIDCQRHSHVHDAQQHNLFSVSSAASAACRLKFMNTIQPQCQIHVKCRVITMSCKNKNMQRLWPQHAKAVTTTCKGRDNTTCIGSDISVQCNIFL